MTEEFDKTKATDDLKNLLNLSNQSNQSPEASASAGAGGGGAAGADPPSAGCENGALIKIKGVQFDNQGDDYDPKAEKKRIKREKRKEERNRERKEERRLKKLEKEKISPNVVLLSSTVTKKPEKLHVDGKVESDDMGTVTKKLDKLTAKVDSNDPSAVTSKEVSTESAVQLEKGKKP